MSRQHRIQKGLPSGSGVSVNVPSDKRQGAVWRKSGGSFCWRESEWFARWLRLARHLPLIALLASGCAPEVPFESTQSKTVLIETETSFGSGVVFKRRSENGVRVFAWTANHVVKKDSEVKAEKILRWNSVKTGQLEFKAKVIFRCSKADVAVVWILADEKWFPGSAVWCLDAPRIGELVFHVGNFKGPNLDGSVSSGILSQIGIQPKFDGWPWENVDQATFIAMHGSSGGGVFNLAGELVGIQVGVVQPGVSLYEPLRKLKTITPDWLRRDVECPGDIWLNVLAEKAAVKPDQDFFLDLLSAP